jgi:hypothetical protein
MNTIEEGPALDVAKVTMTMAQNLLRSIDWDVVASSSYKNYHANGLHYINLLRQDRLTIKLYIFTPQLLLNDRNWIVWPHNHSYNFHHVTILGDVTNHLFEIERGDDFHLFSYDTPLRGGKGLQHLTTCGLREIGQQRCPAGDGYYLDHQHIHTISVTPGEWHAAILLQYDDVLVTPTVMLSPEREPNCSRGLYDKMPRHIARELIDIVRDKMGDAI